MTGDGTSKEEAMGVPGVLSDDGASLSSTAFLESRLDRLESLLALAEKDIVGAKGSDDELNAILDGPEKILRSTTPNNILDVLGFSEEPKMQAKKKKRPDAMIPSGGETDMSEGATEDEGKEISDSLDTSPEVSLSSVEEADTLGVEGSKEFEAHHLTDTSDATEQTTTQDAVTQSTPSDEITCNKIHEMEDKPEDPEASNGEVPEESSQGHHQPSLKEELEVTLEEEEEEAKDIEHMQPEVEEEDIEKLPSGQQEELEVTLEEEETKDIEHMQPEAEEEEVTAQQEEEDPIDDVEVLLEDHISAKGEKENPTKVENIAEQDKKKEDDSESMEVLVLPSSQGSQSEEKRESGSVELVLPDMGSHQSQEKDGDHHAVEEDVDRKEEKAKKIPPIQPPDTNATLPPAGSGECDIVVVKTEPLLFQSDKLLADLKDEFKKPRAEVEEDAGYKEEEETPPIQPPDANTTLPPTGSGERDIVAVTSEPLLFQSGKFLVDLKDEFKKLRAEYHRVEANNKRLSHANSSAGHSFESLNQHAQKLQKKLESSQTEAKEGVAALKGFTTLVAELRDELAMKQALYVAEVQSRLRHQKALQEIADIVQNKCKDSAIVEKILRIADKVEEEAMATPAMKTDKVEEESMTVPSMKETEETNSVAESTSNSVAESTSGGEDTPPADNKNKRANAKTANEKRGGWSFIKACVWTTGEH